VSPYESVTGNPYSRLGTSGLVYRSNKLMFDFDTNSLWGRSRGGAVVGDLVGRGLQLTRRSIATTTWGEWRRRHPWTAVLSLETGYYRGYSRGVAYCDCFATDGLLFGCQDPVDLSVEFLSEPPVFHA